MNSRISGLNSSELLGFAGTGFETSSGRQTGEDMVYDDKITRLRRYLLRSWGAWES